MIELLRANPLLLLFLVAAIGYPLGRLKVGEAGLGVAAVLFVGLFFGALDPDLKLPEVIQQFGLALFVYCIGLSSGQGFFRSFRGAGLRYNLFALGLILATAGLMLVPHLLLGLRAGQTVGLFTGVLTTTPAMAAVVESLKHQAGASLTDPVVGYSIAYPASVLGMILTIYAVQRLWRINYPAEAQQLRGVTGVAQPLSNLTIQVEPTSPALGLSIPQLVAQHGWKVVFGRIRRNQHDYVVGSATSLQAGDLITVVGCAEDLAPVISCLGHLSHHHADMDRTDVDMRRIFLSDPQVAGLRLRDLQLTHRYGAVVTRVRRGDMELLPHADLVLELGDRVRVLAPRETMSEVARFFGDSYKAISEIDITSLSIGLVAGIFLGLLPIPLPGGITLRLGLAGGPLIVALVLGAVSRTGPMVWTLPYSASVLLRQVGLILFLAAVGTRSGYAFATTLASGSGAAMFAAALVLICVVSLGALFVGYRLLKIPMGLLLGVLAGAQTQAATLGFALEQTQNELPNLSYATVYPIATVFKILLAQVLLTLLL